MLDRQDRQPANRADGRETGVGGAKPLLSGCGAGFRGRIPAEVMNDSAPFASLETEVPLSHLVTPCLVFGNWFAC